MRRQGMGLSWGGQPAMVEGVETRNVGGADRDRTDDLQPLEGRVTGRLLRRLRLLFPEILEVVAEDQKAAPEAQE